MKPGLRYLVVLALLVFCQPILFAQKTQPPAFEKYPADVWAGKPAPLNLRSHRLARMFRTRIREQLREEGINFAGHYTVTVMGCGTGCSITAIVDSRNGRAYFPRVFDGWTSEIGDYPFAEGENIRTFKTDSRLMKVIGRPRLGAMSDGDRAASITTNGETISCGRCISSRPALIRRGIVLKRIKNSLIYLSCDQERVINPKKAEDVPTALCVFGPWREIIITQRHEAAK